jgi:hypothetical protein
MCVTLDRLPPALRAPQRWEWPHPARLARDMARPGRQVTVAELREKLAAAARYRDM